MIDRWKAAGCGLYVASTLLTIAVIIRAIRFIGGLNAQATRPP